MEDEGGSDLEHGLALSLGSPLFLSSVHREGIPSQGATTPCPPSLAGTWAPDPISDPTSLPLPLASQCPSNLAALTVCLPSAPIPAATPSAKTDSRVCRQEAHGKDPILQAVCFLAF